MAVLEEEHTVGRVLRHTTVAAAFIGHGDHRACVGSSRAVRRVRAQPDGVGDPRVHVVVAWRLFWDDTA